MMHRYAGITGGARVMPARMRDVKAAHTFPRTWIRKGVDGNRGSDGHSRARYSRCCAVLIAAAGTLRVESRAMVVLQASAE
jgi:hypothetical protein